MQTLDLSSRPVASPKLFEHNRTEVLKRLQQSGVRGAIHVQGFPEPGRRFTDYEPLFRQCSMFYYLSGVNEPDCSLFIDINTRHTVLFYPDIPKEMEIWSGPLPTHQQISEKYQIEVKSKSEEAEFIKSYTSEIHGYDDQVLKALSDQRQFKSSEEIQLIEYASEINNLAYRKVLKSLTPGQFEYQVEAEMQHVYFAHNCLYPPFQITVCSGELCSILHYHKKTRQINTGELVLIDAGCEYELYCSDNTRTFPSSGLFSEDQKLVYQAVLDAQKAVISAARPGVPWQEMAILSAKVMAQGLVKAGLLVGDIDEIVESGALAVFYPHGLGHGMGLDVHEVGGWPEGTVREDKPHISRLRLGRILEEGMVVTVEPGCYFIKSLYEKAFDDQVLSRFIVKGVCERLRETVGGVRIEDDILIVKGGNRNLSAGIPKEIDEIERLMREK